MYELNPYIILYQNLLRYWYLSLISRVTRRVLLVEQGLLTLPEHLIGYVYVC
jgi:hypothetical protein